MTDTLDPPDSVVVHRWTRYGKDRAYVARGELQLGYRDLQTGDVHLEVEGHRTTLERATDGLWSEARRKRYTPRHATTAVANPAAPTLQPDRDLRTHLPGQAVHERARELRDAAPVRSRVERFLGVKNDERAWRIGGDAEEAVAKRLASLGPGWHVLHAIPVGERGSDIDHLVIGPPGVFTVNAKNHPDATVWVGGDTIRVNGTSQPYVRNSRYEAARAAKLLTARALFDVEVRSLIAIMGMQKGFTVKEQPRGGVVTVVQRKRVADHLRGLPPVLGLAAVDRIADVARHLATWQPKTVAWDDDL